MRYSLLCTAAALVGACAPSTDTATIEIVYDPCEPLVVVAENATDAERASISRAVDMWNMAADTRISDEPIAEASELEVWFEDASPVFFGLYEDEVGDILINRRLDDPDARAVTVAHEIGHALGLFHVSGRSSIMNEGNLEIGVTAGDVIALRELWGRCSQASPESVRRQVPVSRAH